MSQPSNEIVVIGAGPAGLAAGAAAREVGFEPLLVERELMVGGCWRKFAPDMRCLSPRIRDAMPDGVLTEGEGPRPLAGEVLAAIEAYAQRARFDIQLGVTALGLTVGDGKLVLRTSAGDIDTRRLVVATGEYANPFHLPLTGRFDGVLQHSSEFEPWTVETDERVVVIGAGNSGAEIASSLSRRGVKVVLLTRRPVKRPRPEPTGALGEIFWKLSGLEVKWFLGGGCSYRTPLVDPDLYDAIKDGRVRVGAGAAALLPNGVLTADGKEVACDRIVMATGFRRDTEWLAGAVTLDHMGIPKHDRGVSTEVGRLGFLGIPCMRTRRSGFLRGLPGDARHVVRRIK